MKDSSSLHFLVEMKRNKHFIYGTNIIEVEDRRSKYKTRPSCMYLFFYFIFITLTGGVEFVALYDARAPAKPAITHSVPGATITGVDFFEDKFLLAQSFSDRQFIFDRRKP